MKIAMYTTVSTNNEGQGNQNHLHELRAFVERRASEEWTLGCEYVDNASDKTAGRPAFRKMLEDASRKRFDLVLFCALRGNL